MTFFLVIVLFLVFTPAFARLLICEFVLFRGGQGVGFFLFDPPPFASMSFDLFRLAHHVVALIQSGAQGSV